MDLHSDPLLNESIDTMVREISVVLPLKSFWLYGSVVLDDFRAGWSDIDFIAFTDEPITSAQAEKLLTLRQELTSRCPGSPYYRSFEGVLVNLNEYRDGTYTRLIYWGTSGQRITDRYRIDTFSMFELSKYGVCVCGEADRELFKTPTREDLIAAVRSHYDGIRRCAVQTDDSIYSCGWLLDIARCIYTLRFNDVIGKTQAGEWAFSEHLFRNDEPLRKTLEIRRSPLAYRNDPKIKTWLESLGPTVQQYADVLERELDQ